MSARRKFARRVRTVPLPPPPLPSRARPTVHPRQYAIDVDAVRFDRSAVPPELREAVDAERVEAALRGERVLCLDAADARSHAERVRRALRARESDDRLLCGFSAVDMTTGERIAPERLRYQNGIVYVNESPRELSWSDARITVNGHPRGPLVEVEFDGVRHVAPMGRRFA